MTDSESRQNIISLAGIVASFLIAVWQIETGKSQNKESLENAIAIAARQHVEAATIARDQNLLAVHLNEIEQWRKKPQLDVLRSQAVRSENESSDEINCTIQNSGGRDLVIFGIDLTPLTPSSESKQGSTESMAVAALRGPVIAADRSKVERIDLSRFNLERESVFRIDPAIILKPGESLTLKFIFATPSRQYIVCADTNAADPKLPDPDDLFGQPKCRCELFHFERSW